MHPANHDLVFAFCTTCRDRRGYVERCLPRSMEILPENSFYVLLDYNSPDGVRDWVLRQFPANLEKGRLRLFSEQSFPRFRTPHAKNVCHLLAVLGGADVLVNVDADNWLTPGFLEILLDHDWTQLDFLSARNTPRPARRRPGEKDHVGGRGRLCVRRSVFLSMGGYDEGLVAGWGGDEVDLEWRMERTQRAGAYYAVPEDSWMDNTFQERSRPLLKQYKNPIQAHNDNRRRSLANLEAGRLIANVGLTWGRASVVDYREQRLEIGYASDMAAERG